MREKELREAATCGLCKEKIGKSGLPLFMRVKVERHGLLPSIQRQQGLAMVMGGGESGAVLASVLGPNEEMTKIIASHEITVCEACAIEHHLVHLILEAAPEAAP